MTIIQGICIAIIILALITVSIGYMKIKASDSMETEESEYIEYERECAECGDVCYHYDNKPYDMSRVIYCGKHSHMYASKCDVKNT
jgi:hypothetical protein